MSDREKVIRGLESHGAGESLWILCHNCPYCKEDISMDRTNNGCVSDLMRDALALLKEQDELLRKLQKDKDKLCLEVSEWKHKFHDRPEQDKENGHWIVLEYCANEGIYCSKCMNKIFDRSTKPKKKLSNYCPNCGSKNTHFFNPSTEKIMYSD